MTDFQIALLLVLNWINGIVLGYIFWEPDSHFKRGLINGLSLKFIWGRFFK